MKTNLEELRTARGSIPMKHHRAFHDFFVGALACHVKKEAWNEALKIAKQCVEQYEKGDDDGNQTRSL